MRLPKDWDKPSPGNEELCRQFEYGFFEERGGLPYRLFIPKAEGKLPLVVYLHGADAFGDDNEAQLSMHDIGTVFARESSQRSNPCFILAPQCRPRDHWSLRSSGGKVCDLIKKLIVDHKRIDEDRIYIYGYSAGGIGTLRIVKEMPQLFAAACSICGATERDKLDILRIIPLWLFHAVDDEIVRSSFSTIFSENSLLGSSEVYNELKDSAYDIHYTEYKAGHMKEKYGLNPHCSWVPAGEDPEFRKWLFNCRLGRR